MSCRGRGLAAVIVVVVVGLTLPGSPRPARAFQARSTAPPRPGTPAAAATTSEARARPAPPTSDTVLDVRNYGARTGDNQDDAAAVQRALDAAAAAGGRVVYLPAGVYNFAKPVIVKGRNITLRGDTPGGTRVVPVGQYGGPLVAVGMPARTIDSQFRPPAGRGVYDASAATGNRHGITTKGKAVLAVTGHTLQFGPLGEGNAPDYWAGGGIITLDIFLERPSGVTWAENTPIVGICDGFHMPAPWFLFATTTGFALDYSTTEKDGRHRTAIPADVSAGRWRISIQLDLDRARVAAWINRRPVAAKILPDWPAAGKGAIPGAKLVQSEGFAPLVIGTLKPFCGAIPENEMYPMTIYGLRVTRAQIYDWDSKAQTLAHSPATPVTDTTQFFSDDTRIVPVGKLCGLLPLDDSPGDGHPWVTILHSNGTGCLFWCPALSQNDTAGIGVEDLALEGFMQPALMVAEHSGLRVERVNASASQGIGTFPVHGSWPAVFRDCWLAGYDAALQSHMQILSTSHVNISMAGREAVRQFGGNGTHDDLHVWRIAKHTEVVFWAKGTDNGDDIEVNRMLVDNEEFPGPKRAIFRLESSAVNWGSFGVTNPSVGMVPKGAAYFELVGHGFGKAYGSYAPYGIEIRNPAAYFHNCEIPLRVVGPPTFYGTVDCRRLGKATTEGEPASLKRLNILQPVKFEE